MAQINFRAGSLAGFLGLATKDANTLYFIEDAKKIYKGDVDMTEAIKVVDNFDAAPGADIVEGKLYINAATFEVRVKNGDAWVVMTPGYIAAGDDFTSENGGKLATIGATMAYITEQIANITDGTAFVKDVTWTDGKLMVDNGAEQAKAVELTGVAHAPVYDKEDLKLTIPVYGQEDIVVDIPKDNFIRDGRYEAKYKLPNGEMGEAIVLVVDNESADSDGDVKEIVIPAAALVHDHTGGTTTSIKVAVSDGNEITANIIIDPVAGNALVLTEAGLKVDISGKADKLAEAVEGNVFVQTADGNLADSGVSIKKSGEMGDSATELPVASLIAAAIAAAVKKAQDSLQEQLNAITNEEGTGRLDKLEDDVANIGDSIVGEGDAGKVVVSTESGIARSEAAIGGETLAEEANANTLATEAAVVDAMSWKPIA